jgi:CBS domain containing-hemolysin-like protein
MPPNPLAMGWKPGLPGRVVDARMGAVEILRAIVDFLAFDPARLLAPDMAARLGLQILLLCGSAFFSGSETALFSLSRVDLQQLRQRRHPHAATLHELLDEPRRLIVSILCGNEVVNIASVSNMTGILVALYGEAKAGWITVGLMLPVLLLVGEVTPKTIAVSDPRRVSADFVARPMSVWVRLVAPLRWVIRSVSDRITTWIVGPKRTREHILKLDEFKSLVEDFAEAGEIKASSRALIHNLLAAATTEIVAVMTPRSSTAFIDADEGLAGALETFGRVRHWRIPVYRGHRDNLVGFLYAEDVVRLKLEGEDASTTGLEDVLRPPIVVPLTKKVDEMFDFFRRNDTRAAAVLNEFGGVAGFITMNDVLRFILGPLMGRSHVETRVVEVAPEVFEAAGDTKLEDFNRITNLGLSDPRMTTVAGVAFRHLDRLPHVGDVAEVEGLTITVLEMDVHRIARVRVARGKPSDTEVPPGDEETEA